MQEILISNWPDFSLGKKPGQRDIAQLLLNRARIMVRHFKQPRASAIAGKEQCTAWMELLILFQANK
jgi:hypothetical protein